MNNKLEICFIIWLLLQENDDYDSVLAEIKSKGFNCIRFEDGAGLLWDLNGNNLNDITLYPPFGKYTERTTFHEIKKGKINVRERLLKLCSAAKRQGISLILSSWFFLHTNWLCEQGFAKQFFDMPDNEKLSYFANELDKILNLLRENDLIDVVAFAEIFNEFDGLSFTINYCKRQFTDEELYYWRDLHEKEIEKLKKSHPDVLFAYDSYTPWINEKLLPRNIDVLNYHHYYAWVHIYGIFQQNYVSWTLEEGEIPETAKRFLIDNPIKVKDVVEESSFGLVTGVDWGRRIALYSSVDPNKQKELEELFEKTLVENLPKIRNDMRAGLEHLMKIHDEVVPNSKIVMGEGCTYCPLNDLEFECNSDTYFEIIKEYTKLCMEYDFWGVVIGTDFEPCVATWKMSDDKYKALNKIIIGE